MKRRPRNDRLETALAALFERPKTPASWFSLTGGARLFSAGDQADMLYLVRSGRLGVFRSEEGRETEFVGVVRGGEPAGEMSLLAGTPHTSTVVALRDSEILALPRDEFLKAAREQPDLMTELARLVIKRAREKSRSAAAPSVFGLISKRDRPIRPFADRLAAAVDALGFSIKIIDRSALNSAAEWFNRVEDVHDYVLYVAEKAELSWAALCARQVDRLFVIGDCQSAPSAPFDSEQIHVEVQRPTDLILLRPAGTSPACTNAWIEAAQPARWFHVREGDTSDEARIARVLTGTSVGLVLSGGGARAYAHLGAIRVLSAAGVPFDFVGGSSMGGVVGAGLALEWSQEEQEARIRAAFVDSNPLSDIAFPIIAMSRGNRVAGLLEEHYGDVEIEDLALPFFCVSANITTNSYKVHRQGLLRQALRASISLPGVLPPVIDHGSVLVDGAVMKSFPADLMRAQHLGPVVGVDVSRARGIDPKAVEPKSWWRWILSGDWRQGPPIVSILMRSATITGAGELAASRKATDVLIMPRLDGVEIRNWKAFEPAIAAGEQAAREALQGLDGPITHIRARAVEAEADAAAEEA